MKARINSLETDLNLKNEEIVGYRKGKTLTIDPPERYNGKREDLKKFLI